MKILFFLKQKSNQFKGYSFSYHKDTIIYIDNLFLGSIIGIITFYYLFQNEDNKVFVHHTPGTVEQKLVLNISFI